MQWFLLSLIAFFFWSGSDFFSKLGSRPDDKLSHWKMVIAVGLVMGLHALWEVTVGGVQITFSDILVYLPASALYIGSMILGYIGLRYIELSISSPICNCSGAVAAILCFLFLHEIPGPLSLVAVALIGVGLVSLGIVERREDEEARALRQAQGIRYSRSALALILPLLYCLLDALGTFIDAIILRDEDTGTFLDALFPTPLAEETANVCYELTFLFMGILAAVYVFVIRKERPRVPREAPKLFGAVCETAGQLAYVYALGDTEHAGFSAAIISAYCAMSVLLSRLFLKEKLSLWHYLSILLAFAGIIILGVIDP